jgi:transcriptional regulator with XRE-family HTH domain
MRDAARSPLASLRREHGLTQAEVAEKSGVPVTYISDIERGRQGNLNSDTIKRIAKGLGVRSSVVWTTLFPDEPRSERGA